MESHISYIDKNSAVIYLVKEVYSKESIQNCFDIYEEFLDCLIESENDKYYIVKFISKTEDYTIEVLVKEFLNYLISEEYKYKR